MGTGVRPVSLASVTYPPSGPFSLYPAAMSAIAFSVRTATASGTSPSNSRWMGTALLGALPGKVHPAATATSASTATVIPAFRRVRWAMRVIRSRRARGLPAMVVAVVKQGEGFPQVRRSRVRA